jgi:PAS domain S-box-containing protein
MSESKPHVELIEEQEAYLAMPGVLLILTLCLTLSGVGYLLLKQWDDAQIQKDLEEVAYYQADVYKAALIYQPPYLEQTQSFLPAELNLRIDGLYWQANFDATDSFWRVSSVPTDRFLLKKRNSIVWLLPSMGGVLTLILGFFLFNNLSRVQKVELMVATRTAELSQEIQDRKRAEHSLEETLSLMKAIFESANQTIIATDIFGIIRSFNRTAERLLGYAADEVVGKMTLEIIHLPDEVMNRAAILSKELGFPVEPGFETFVAKTRMMGLPDDNEWSYVRKDGSKFPIFLSVTTLRDVEGHITGYVGIGYDITERKKVDRMKSEFISTVSHELRTPLTSIRGSLGLIAGGLAGAMPPQAKPLVEIAMNNCERLVRLINDILDIEKIESGKMEFRNRPFALVPLLEQALLANEAYGRQFGVRFRLEFDGGDARVNADPDHLTQVVTNLLSNAAKFSPHGSEVLVSAKRVGGKIRVSVRDQGPGISDTFKSRIFQKFAQADASDSRQKGGTGLGLYICKTIIEKLHGVIGFENALGKGTVFFFELPEHEPSSKRAAIV